MLSEINFYTRYPLPFHTAGLLTGCGYNPGGQDAKMPGHHRRGTTIFALSLASKAK
jgi:hypothetical protein